MTISAGPPPRKTLVKICGVTTPEQALSCVAAGADWIGLNGWPKSKRFIPLERMQEITHALPNDVTAVGVFVNASADTLHEAVEVGGVTCLQLHGDEPPEFAHALRVPWFRAFRPGPEFRLQDIDDYGQTRFLLDAYQPGHYGGTGQTLDWELAQQATHHGDLLLAGGLTPANVAEAIRRVQPFGVDTASGVESAPGFKDLAKVRAFVHAVREADSRLASVGASACA